MRPAFVVVSLCVLVSPGLALAQPAAAPPAKARPWRADQALGFEWLRFGLEHRSRLEHLSGDFRSGAPDSATVLSMKTLLSAELVLPPLVLGAELIDSRAYGTEGARLNTTIVDPLDLLQLYGSLRGKSVLLEGDATALTVGRITLDVGSRRLVARNDFRNTVNAFTGVDAQWMSPKADLVRAFAVVPVVRLPTETAAVKANRPELDRENFAAVLWGVFAASRPLGPRIVVEGYLLGLHETDSAQAASSNRRLFTPGVRVLRAPAAGSFDFQLEVMGQFGTSRASAAATDTTDLRHLAFSMHASVGYRFAVWGAPRLVAQYDFASGDRDGRDGENNRFDTLFGARRFDFGPTGIYGALARSNMNSPGLRLEVAPHSTLDAFIAYRPAFLASARDGWTTAGLKDPTGARGSFLGHQVEVRVRWNVLGPNFGVDLGGACLFGGTYAGVVPNARAEPAVYAYAQLTGRL